MEKKNIKASASCILRSYLLAGIDEHSIDRKTHFEIHQNELKNHREIENVIAYYRIHGLMSPLQVLLVAWMWYKPSYEEDSDEALAIRNFLRHERYPDCGAMWNDQLSKEKAKATAFLDHHGRIYAFRLCHTNADGTPGRKKVVMISEENSHMTVCELLDQFVGRTHASWAASHFELYPPNELLRLKRKFQGIQLARQKWLASPAFGYYQAAQKECRLCGLSQKSIDSLMCRVPDYGRRLQMLSSIAALLKLREHTLRPSRIGSFFRKYSNLRPRVTHNYFLLLIKKPPSDVVRKVLSETTSSNFLGIPLQGITFVGYYIEIKQALQMYLSPPRSVKA